MDTKLTLKLNASVIDRAKKYAADKQLSLSRIVENYLDSLTKKEGDEDELSDFIKSFDIGQSLMDDPQNDRQDYRQHLEEKYK